MPVAALAIVPSEARLYSRVHLAACIPTKNSPGHRFPSGVACDVIARPLTSLGLPLATRLVLTQGGWGGGGVAVTWGEAGCLWVLEG